jgi:hypothetical protein
MVARCLIRLRFRIGDAADTAPLLTARTNTRPDGDAPAAADVPGALAEIVLRYNLANTRWELPAGLFRRCQARPFVHLYARD